VLQINSQEISNIIKEKAANYLQLKKIFDFLDCVNLSQI